MRQTSSEPCTAAEADTTAPAVLAALRGEAVRVPDDGLRASVSENTRRLKMRSANVKTLFEAGFLLAAGTDAPYPGVFQGEGLHRELELIVEAGLRPLDGRNHAGNAKRRSDRRQRGGVGNPGAGQTGESACHRRASGSEDQDTRNIETVMCLGRIVNRQELRLKPGARLND